MTQSASWKPARRVTQSCTAPPPGTITWLPVPISSAASRSKEHALTVPPPEPGTERRASLAARLRDLRAAAGLSGNALAHRMGVVQSRVWKIENEKLLQI